MADFYFRDFWIETTDGRKLFLARIVNQLTGRSTYRQLSSETNLTTDNVEYGNPRDAVMAFLAGGCMRFGAQNTDDRGFSLTGRLVKSTHATKKFRAENPDLAL
ncbi:MAG: hypothetical protein JNL14_20185 [Devosia sp.]|jgi:hypothetical protein|uniref:hypothetical protein n=1 Tax=Devosia sp. TaxID=1871048 RepID=UPI001A5C41CD|nr:hypothetical protein [Devosia sp.]MBL8600062.1 hypothetical protein [Devosia sp.]